ncbi:MAG: hypothetical protein HY735_33785 [Verrucomicrobia bacterium]|nr:hypothetical protein [Verrucomicrobiota bacterium]
MISTSIDHRLKFQQWFWYGLIGFCALLAGYYLARNSVLVALGVVGVLGLMTLPYHSKLSIILAVATFNSALIVPLFPGRPYVWEFAALLGWSGLIIILCMRQYAPDSARVLREHRWLVVGVIGYCLILMVTMFYRGVGLRIFGSGQMGGRYYFQQLTCAIFPFLFVFCRPSEKTIVRLLIWQYLLTTTYLISDFVLSKAPEALLFVLQFFELSGDAVNFELQALRFGIRRYQSFYVVCSGLFFLMLLRYNLRDFFGRKALYLVPMALTTLSVGMVSGHRYLAVIILGVLAFSSYAERFFTMRNTFIALGGAVLVLSTTYAIAERLPLAAQRVVSFLPAVKIDPRARIDADNTLEVRRVLRKIGMDMAPQYFWIGRGFEVAAVDYSWDWDPTTITGHVNQGRFFNGFVGLMVNTGVFGTAFMILFLSSGALLGWRILRHLRNYGCEDDFSRVCKLVASLWIGNVIAFIFLHGDSEYALKTFSIQAGLMLTCHQHLQRRLAAGANEAPVTANPAG